MKLLGNRFYDPSIGRFLTRDQAKDGMNWYAYCANNPITAYDANGLEWIIIYAIPGAQGHGKHAGIGFWDGHPNHTPLWFGFYPDGVHAHDVPPSDAVLIYIWVERSEWLDAKRRAWGDHYESAYGTKGPKYRLQGYNCSDWIEDVLAEAGIEDNGASRNPMELVSSLSGRNHGRPDRIPIVFRRPSQPRGGKSGK